MPGDSSKTGTSRSLVLFIAGLFVFILPVFYFLRFLEKNLSEDQSRRDTYARQILLEETARFREGLAIPQYLESVLRKLDREDGILNLEGTAIHRLPKGKDPKLFTPQWARKRLRTLRRKFGAKPQFILFCGADFRNPKGWFKPKLANSHPNPFFSLFTTAFLHSIGDEDTLIPWFRNTSPVNFSGKKFAQKNGFRSISHMRQQLGRALFGKFWDPAIQREICRNSFSNSLGNQNLYIYSLPVFSGKFPWNGRSFLGAYIVGFSESDLDWKRILSYAVSKSQIQNPAIQRYVRRTKRPLKLGFHKNAQGYLLKNSGETEMPWRAQSARPRGMSHANSLRVAKGGACPPLLRSYAQGISYISDCPQNPLEGLYSQDPSLADSFFSLEVLFLSETSKNQLVSMVKSVRFLSAFLIFLSCFLTCGVIAGKIEFGNVGLRLKLMTIVSLIAVFPMAGTGFQIWRYFHHLEEMGETNLKNRVESTLSLWEWRIKESANRNLVRAWKFRAALAETMNEPLPKIKEFLTNAREKQNFAANIFLFFKDGRELFESNRPAEVSFLQVFRLLGFSFLESLGSLENASKSLIARKQKLDFTYGVALDDAWNLLSLTNLWCEEGLETIDLASAKKSARGYFFLLPSISDSSGIPFVVTFIPIDPRSAYVIFLNSISKKPPFELAQSLDDGNLRMAVFECSVWGLGRGARPNHARHDPRLEKIAQAGVNSLRHHGFIRGNGKDGKYLGFWNFVDPYPYIVVAEASMPKGRWATRFTDVIIFGLFLYSFLILLTFADFFAAVFLRPIQGIVEVIQGIGKGRLSGQVILNTGDELSSLGGTVNQMIDAIRQNEHLRRFVPVRLVQQIVSETHTQVRKPEKVQATILMSDIRGFTAVSEKYPTEMLVDALNDYFTLMDEAIAGNNGEILKLIGDAVFAIFYPEDDRDPPPQRGCRAAIDMKSALQKFNQLREKAGLFSVENGIGLATGDILSGEIGLGEKRRDFTAIGDSVRLAGLLESISRRGKATGIILCEATNTAIADFWETLELARETPEEPSAWEVQAARK